MVLTVLSSFLRQSCLVFTNVTSALEVFLNVMRYINPRFTYLLTFGARDGLGRQNYYSGRELGMRERDGCEWWGKGEWLVEGDVSEEGKGLGFEEGKWFGEKEGLVEADEFGEGDKFGGMGLGRQIGCGGRWVGQRHGLRDGKWLGKEMGWGGIMVGEWRWLGVGEVLGREIRWEEKSLLTETARRREKGCGYRRVGKRDGL